MKTASLTRLKRIGGGGLRNSSITAPKLYKVVMHKDDYTPTDFLLAVLEDVFNYRQDTAVELMDKIYLAGKAICGVFSLDVACTKVDQVAQYAAKSEYPLLCSLEEGA